MEVSAALDYAHQAGVCHGSLKPGNILLADDGTVKAADFSIARAAPRTTPAAPGGPRGRRQPSPRGGQGRRRRRPGRRLRPRSLPVRDAHRPAPRCRPVHHHPAPRPAGRGAARPGHDRPPGDGHRPRRPLPDRPGHGRRPLPSATGPDSVPSGEFLPITAAPTGPRPPPPGASSTRAASSAGSSPRSRWPPSWSRSASPWPRTTSATVRPGHAGEDPREPDHHRQRQPHPGRRRRRLRPARRRGRERRGRMSTRSTGARPAPGRPTATRAPGWGGLKTGVGLVLSLEAPRQARDLALILTAAGADFTVYGTPTTPSPTVSGTGRLARGRWPGGRRRAANGEALRGREAALPRLVHPPAAGRGWLPHRGRGSRPPVVNDPSDEARPAAHLRGDPRAFGELVRATTPHLRTPPADPRQPGGRRGRHPGGLPGRPAQGLQLPQGGRLRPGCTGSP